MKSHPTENIYNSQIFLFHAHLECLKTFAQLTYIAFLKAKNVQKLKKLSP